MRFPLCAAAGAVVLAAALHAQQPQPSQPAQASQPAQPSQAPASGDQQAKVPEPPYTIYRVELVPAGFGFAMNEPVLEGDFWVFRSLPDKALERVPKSKVKSVSRWSTDYTKEVVYQVELAPSGSVLAREEPVKKGERIYVFTTWRQGTLLSVNVGDVKNISRLTGFPAFKAEMLELGVVVLETETTHAGFKQTADAPAPGQPSSPASAGSSGQGNWTYYGTPGASDAYAPGNATVSKPGDTPMMPQPTQPPR
ncbi:MAG TPA: hypothetical protein VL084_00410 [Thermoanaerobaculia bacterium]|nr:hypothetical protein [Thermoanaerobaculia bacterium]